MNDADLLNQYVAGSQAAFGKLVRRHIDLVYAVAQRRVRDQAAAEDVTQAVFVLLARKPAALRGRPTAVGWLTAAVRHVGLTHMRATARRHHHERAAAREEAVVPTDPPHPGPLLDDALARLRPADRDALTLRYFKNLPLADVGRTLGIGEDAARKRVARAIDRLRVDLRGHGVRVRADLLATTAQAYGHTPAPARVVAATLAAIPVPPATPPVVIKGVLRMLVGKKIGFASIAVLAAVSGVALAVREIGNTTAALPAPVPASRPVAARPDVPLQTGEAYIGGLTGQPGAYSVNTYPGDSGKRHVPTLRVVLHEGFAPEDRPLEVHWIRRDGNKSSTRIVRLERLGNRPDGGPGALDELVRPDDQLIVKASGITLSGFVTVAGPLAVPSKYFLPLRDALALAKVNPDVRPLRAYAIVSPPPEPRVEVTNAWPGKVRWVADLNGPLRDTDDSRLRAGDTLCVWQYDPARDADAVRRSAAYLHEIGQALLRIRADTSDLPIDVVDLLTREPKLPAEHLFSPRLTPQVPPQFGQCDRGALISWVQREADYVYTPPAWTAPLPADWVLVREPTDIGLAEVLVLRGDGHVELRPAAEVAAQVRRQTPTTQPALPNG